MTLTTEMTVRQIAIENPAAVDIFEARGIDYCCGGERPLAEACERASVPVEEILELLAKEPAGIETTRNKWTNATLADLTQYIVERHHTFVRQEIPRLQALFQKVEEHHAAAHPELSAIRGLFGAMAEELSSHLMKEEQVLFPYLERMEAAARGDSELPPACFPSVEMPIARMLAEHSDAGALLEQIRSLANDFQPPESACPSYRRLYSGLEEFERDLHQHIQLENNFLFPRSAELERSLSKSRR